MNKRYNINITLEDVSASQLSDLLSTLAERVKKSADIENITKVYDVNGNSIGSFDLKRLRAAEMMVRDDGTVDFQAAFNKGRVYQLDWIDACEEYRFFVLTDGSEYGYHEEYLRGWITDVSGNLLEESSEEDGAQMVRERDITPLSPAEKNDIRKVLSGELSVDDYNQQFRRDDNDLSM
jgi:hypothetical protein